MTGLIKLLLPISLAASFIDPVCLYKPLKPTISLVYFRQETLQPIFVTLFGKTRLNENSVEPFFHFNAFWKRSNALQIIFNAF